MTVLLVACSNCSNYINYQPQSHSCNLAACCAAAVGGHSYQQTCTKPRRLKPLQWTIVIRTTGKKQPKKCVTNSHCAAAAAAAAGAQSSCVVDWPMPLRGAAAIQSCPCTSGVLPTQCNGHLIQSWHPQPVRAQILLAHDTRNMMQYRNRFAASPAALLIHQ
jgi:hypothetical protein